MIFQLNEATQFTIESAPITGTALMLWSIVACVVLVTISTIGLVAGEPGAGIGSGLVAGGIVFFIGLISAAIGVTRAENSQIVDALQERGYSEISLNSDDGFTGANQDGQYVKAQFVREGNTFIILEY